MKKMSIPIWYLGLAATSTLSMLVAAPASASDELRIGGTGMALAAMQQAGANLSALEPGIQVVVLPSLGTPGGLRALADDAIHIAVTGRRLKADEKAKGAVEAGCTTTPLVFASSHPSPNGVTKAELPNLFSASQPVWRDGKPLNIILRSRAGSENDYLKAAIPGMEAALGVAYNRPGVPIATTDQENAEHASRIAGSFTVMTMLQIRGEKPNLRPVPLDGVVPSAATLADESYPLSATVCLVLPAAPRAAAPKLIAYLKSEPGQALLRSLGATPLK